MKFIRVRRTNCKNCYKCIKNCLVKSISYKGDLVDVIDEGCILCGKCITTCPRGGKKLDNDYDYIKSMIKANGIKVCASLSSDFVANYPKNAFKLSSALRKLGFDYVEESSVAGACVTEEYRRLILLAKGKTIISSACPTINLFIKKYYPDLVPYLAPIMTPLEAHGKLIKAKYGENTKVIYIGPCLSALKECEDSPYLDGGIVYNQLNAWLSEENISFDDLEEEPFDEISGYSRIYPIQGGITKDIINIFDEYEGTDAAGGYNLLSASGLNNAKKMLDELQNGAVSNVFAEIWACEGACISGPFATNKTGRYEKLIKVKKYADTAKPARSCIIANIGATPQADPYSETQPTENIIKSILAQMGKYTKAQELDCGICGYPTCREKAIAVYHHKADVHMCMPYLLNINQTLSNTVLTLTPNMIIAVDSAMLIKEFNVAAQRIFRVARRTVIGKPISDLIDDSNFRKVFETKTGIFDKTVCYEDLGLITEQTILYSPEHNLAIATIKDITDEEESRKKAYDKKMQSLELAQKVIDKQMFVAQEIAGLLGETTAETKVVLSKLKNLIAAEEMHNNE